jgi:NAD(P)-dependent dehydrogenase (short-subunit alcohol dehydrogenase family)
MNDKNRVVLIVGASSGIGYHCAIHLHNLGYRVYGTSRRADQLVVSASSDERYPFRLIQMDVNDDASVAAGVDNLLQHESRIDVVVNSAGYGIAGAVEDTSIEEAKQQFETNFFGVLRVCRVVLPVMRKQQYGYIINVGSIGGILGIPFQSIYSATKFALEGLSEALRMEVAPFGIRVVLIEPGNYRTEFTASRVTTAGSRENAAYQDTFKRALGVMEQDELNAPEPEAVARVVERAITAKSPRLRYVVDPTVARLAPMLKRLLPYPLVEYGLKHIFKLT